MSGKNYLFVQLHLDTVRAVRPNGLQDVETPPMSFYDRVLGSDLRRNSGKTEEQNHSREGIDRDDQRG